MIQGKIKNSDGFSLIEIIIASTLMCALCLGFGSAIKHQMDSVSLMEDKISSMKLEGDLISLLADPDACFSTFTGLDARSTNPITIRNPSSATFLTGGENGTRVDDLHVQSITPRNVSVSAPSSTGSIEIRVMLTRARSSSDLVDMKDLRIPIFVMVDSNYQIAHCSSDRAVIATRTVASQPTFRNCRFGSTRMDHATSIPGSRIYSDACSERYYCLDGLIVPPPQSCRSGRNSGD